MTGSLILLKRRSTGSTVKRWTVRIECADSSHSLGTNYKERRDRMLDARSRLSRFRSWPSPDLV